jgi:hypothetical protein
MIIMIDTVTRAIDLTDEELATLLDRHGCPAATAGQDQIDRFLDWNPPYECERELRELGEVTDEETEYDTE